jgi:vancomycin permeability regulator SanA
VLALWLVYIAQQIKKQSAVDEAKPADIILVLGAAKYHARPSPVLEARLNHALFLYLQGLAPLVLTTGGAGGDPVYTEGEVGRTYLSRRGVPPSRSWSNPKARAPLTARRRRRR